MTLSPHPSCISIVPYKPREDCLCFTTQKTKSFQVTNCCSSKHIRLGIILQTNCASEQFHSTWMHVSGSSSHNSHMYVKLTFLSNKLTLVARILFRALQLKEKNGCKKREFEGGKERCTLALSIYPYRQQSLQGVLGPPATNFMRKKLYFGRICFAFFQYFPTIKYYLIRNLESDNQLKKRISLNFSSWFFP